jgi:hypothetical protein
LALAVAGNIGYSPKLYLEDIHSGAVAEVPVAVVVVSYLNWTGHVYIDCLAIFHLVNNHLMKIVMLIVMGLLWFGLLMPLADIDYR